MGWHAQRAARALSAGRADAIGLVLAGPARIARRRAVLHPAHLRLQAELSGRRIALLLQVVEDLDAEIAVYRQWWSERRVDAVIVSTCASRIRGSTCWRSWTCRRS